MKRLYILLSLFLISGIAFSQTADDALRYSQQNFNSTARSSSMGGAFGSLGGDFSSISINPAGIAVYQSSQFTFTPTLEYKETTSSGETSNYNDNEDKFSFGIANIGLVTTYKPRFNTEKGWQNFNFAIGYNKLNNYRKSSISRIQNANTSLLDVFVNNSNGSTDSELNSFREYLAFDTYLINPDENDPTLYSAITDERLNQMQTLEEKGYAGEFVIAFGANYNHKLYIGASIGIQNINYKSTKKYTESTQTGSTSEFEEYTFKEYFKSSGYGANLKLGLIYRPTNTLRLGASLHTPTFFSMDEEFKNSIVSHFNTVDDDGYSNYTTDSPFAEYSYNFRTPMRAVFSGAVILQKKLIVSADYELIDYSKAKFYDGEDGDDFNGDFDNPDTNDIIKSEYQNTSNLRAGLEFRITPALSLRTGFSRFGNPFKSSEINEAYNVYSGGWGIKHGNFFFDMAYSYADKEKDYYYYSTPDFASDKINEKNTNHQVRMTFGFKF